MPRVAKDNSNSKVEKKETTKKRVTTSPKKRVQKSVKVISEHYDLPDTYNKTFISLLAQTPKTLFAFWEISEFDRTGIIEKYGSHFFENTRPVLKVINKTYNTSFEIEINDYAKNWYIDVENSACEFEVQLGRKPSTGSVLEDFIIIANSNCLQSPNDFILLEDLPEKIQFLDLKTNLITEKNREDFSFSEIYNIYDFYQKLYKDDLYNNPSSK